MQKLHPRAVWLFIFGMGSSSILAGLIVVVYFVSTVREILLETNDSNLAIDSIVSLWWVWIPLLVVFHVIFAYLTYHFWGFELRENEYRAERGIIWKRYVSIPYTRIQNVDIHRGLIARILGLSDVLIHTAGYGGVGSQGMGSEGRLPGLDKEEAERVRDELLQKARNSGNAGI